MAAYLFIDESGEAEQKDEIIDDDLGCVSRGVLDIFKFERNKDGSITYLQLEVTEEFDDDGDISGYAEDWFAV